MESCWVTPLCCVLAAVPVAAGDCEEVTEDISPEEEGFKLRVLEEGKVMEREGSCWPDKEEDVVALGRGANETVFVGKDLTAEAAAGCAESAVEATPTEADLCPLERTVRLVAVKPPDTEGEEVAEVREVTEVTLALAREEVAAPSVSSLSTSSSASRKALSLAAMASLSFFKSSWVTE